MKKNLEVLESMIYYWNSVNDREKVGEKYITTISEHEMMKPIYNDNFDSESVRKVLSAISNREPFKGKTKNEGRFWNNNMWMLEDMEYMNMIIEPLKKISFEDLEGELEVVFLPLNLDLYYEKDNKLFINFFMLKPDIYSDKGTLKIEEVELKEWLKNKVK